jgi:quercetin dioxygenase-like cupin family protein
MIMLHLAAIIFYALTQDPFSVAPQAYKREFENDRVRVVRVHYGPREKIASHDHPATATVYVYLRSSGPVRFTHTSEEKFIAVRPEVKAGGFRLGRAVKETHEVESLSDQPTDFLRIELKTQAADAQTFRGRFPPDPHSTARSSQKVRFENGQARIVRVTCAARDKCVAGRIASPSLLVALTPARLKTATNDDGASDTRMEPGQTLWVEAGDQVRLENTANAPAEFLRIELKTGPRANQ